MRKFGGRRNLISRMFMLVSRHTWVDGTWVGALGERAELNILVAALGLIRTYDPIRYRRIRSDVGRIWSTILPGRVGEYSDAISTCSVDSRYAARTYPAAVALVIVHEATHARLRRFGYPEQKRRRLELICMGQERAFAKRLPEGDKLVQWIDDRMANPGDYSHAALAKARREGERHAAEELGLPIWIVDAAHQPRDRDMIAGG